MPDINADGCHIHVELEGPERAPVLMLSNSLGTNLHMWDEQVAPFTRHFRLVRYDRRGHGQSDAPKGPYSMEMLGRDVLAILDGLGIAKINWCGLSMGGMVGMWLGARAPERIDKLILSNTTSYFPDKAPWNDRLKFVREKHGRSAVHGKHNVPDLAIIDAWLSDRRLLFHRLSHRRSTILNRVEVGDHFADHLADPVLTSFALTHLVELLSPNRHLVSSMRSGRISPVYYLGDAMRWKRHAIFVAELAQIRWRRRQALRDGTVTETVGAMARRAVADEILVPVGHVIVSRQRRLRHGERRAYRKYQSQDF